MKVYDDIFGGGGDSQRINSKEKGNRNEQALARKLSEWSGYSFTRVPGSGGRKNFTMDVFVGDVAIADKGVDFPFVIETKHLKSFEVLPGKLRSNTIFLRIWKQVSLEAERVGKMSLMFVRMNGMKSDTWYVGLEAGISDACSFQCLSYFNFEDLTVNVMDVGQFFSIDYQRFVSIVKEIKFAEQ